MVVLHLLNRQIITHSDFYIFLNNLFVEIKWSGIFALAFRQRSGSSVGYPEYSGLPVIESKSSFKCFMFKF